MGDSFIPANIMRAITMEPRTDNRDVLVQHLCTEPGTVALTKFQQELLERAQEADRLMRNGMYTRRQMELLLSKKFSYSLETARNDLHTAEYIWGNVQRRNKNYLINRQIDLIDELLIGARRAGNDRFITALLDQRAKLIDKIPEESTGNTTPAAIIFSFSTEALTTLAGEDISATRARDIAQAYLGKDITDIEEEED